MFLIAKGYRIVARRWRSPFGEVDIIARRRRALVFVEVKARNLLDDAAESVTLRQRQRIIGAAEAWLASHPEDAICDIRFDAVLVAPRRMPRHILGAFDPAVEASGHSGGVETRKKAVDLTAHALGDGAEIVDHGLHRGGVALVLAVASPARQISSAVSAVRLAAMSTLRAISCVAAPCW